MSRIHFRVWDNNNDSWCSDCEFWLNNEGTIDYAGSPATEDDDFVIESYLDIMDVNGGRVCEGDYLHIWCTFHRIDMPHAQVFWNIKHLEWDVKVPDGERYKNYLKTLHQRHWKCEIIGNIHEFDRVKGETRCVEN